jgi:hypothetical protein
MTWYVAKFKFWKTITSLRRSGIVSQRVAVVQFANYAIVCLFSEGSFRNPQPAANRQPRQADKQQRCLTWKNVCIKAREEEVHFSGLGGIELPVVRQNTRPEQQRPGEQACRYIVSHHEVFR